MDIFNNTTKVVRDDLEKKIAPGSRVSIAAACFSIYAYQELKAQLEACEELRFIFTSPTFVAEKTPKERREFYIFMVEDITPEYDFKLNELMRVIREKIANPINPGNKKILIFTAFADTAAYLYENVSVMAKKELGLNTA